MKLKRKIKHFMTPFKTEKDKVPQPKDLLKQAYTKQRRKIQNQLYRMRKRGFDTSNIKLPSIPKTITQGSIRRLEKQFSTPKLYEKATYTIPETGEIVSGKKGRNIRRQRPKRQKPETQKREPEKTISQNIPQPEPEPEQINIDDMYDIMVDKVNILIDEMYSRNIPQFATACADAAHRDVQEWLSSHTKEEVVAALKEWDLVEISQSFFSSEDANLFNHERIVARRLSELSAQVKADLPKIEDEDEEFVEIDSEMFSEIPFEFFTQ